MMTSEHINQRLQKIIDAANPLGKLYDDCMLKEAEARKAKLAWETARCRYDSLVEDFTGDLLNGCFNGYLGEVNVTPIDY